MLGEFVPPKIAGVAGAFASMVNWTLAFIVTLGFTYLTAVLGDYGTYWMFAAFGIGGMYFTAKHLPETRGKTLREIQDVILRG